MHSILIGALGGEGGGVLMNWIVEAARAHGLLVQATSVPGVAQRTGSTSYYIEMAENPAAVFALVPMPGRVDVVAVSELVEAARLMERGFVSPRRTLLVTSTSRVLTTAEKMQMGDGRFDSARILEAGASLAQKFVALDLDALARGAATMVSATLFGAMAGAGAFPWPRALCEQAIGANAASLAGFAAAFESAAAQTRNAAPPALEKPVEDAPPAPPALRGAIEALPPAMRMLAARGALRCADYQDDAYARSYVERLARLAGHAPVASPQRDLALEEAARRLALWMTYEDIPRVAALKTQPDRFARIRAEAQMKPEQILTVTEYLKPGADELADILPQKAGEAFLRRVERKGAPGFLGRGLHVRTTGVAGFLTMRALAQFARIRRRSLRFAREQKAIDVWLDGLCDILPQDADFAGALAQLPRLLKGYGETAARGRANYDRIFDSLVAPARKGPRDAARLRQAMAAAMADPDGKALAALLA
ncbi:MAG: indolepyruvate oxidoreductase subunit beta family protein [Hyphomicrobiales bacterium]|nr:indolepyruvate oxidoreductase subunit beta family protein [Hyphomicrobiales bacterium]